jgi:[ribosomal protein S5]-alanine N-acetyltransferase
MRILVTPRMILRPLKFEDLDHFHAYCKKPNIGPSAGWKPHETEEESFRILKLMMSEEDTWAMTLKSSDQIIGTVSLHSGNLENALANKKEVGYALDDTYWGLGLAAEAVYAVQDYAFNVLELDAILCGHYVENIRSRRVIEKTGFNYTHVEERKNYLGIMVPIMMYELKIETYKEKKKNDNQT